MRTIYNFFILFVVFLFTCCKVKNMEAHDEPTPCTIIEFYPEERRYIFENWYKVDSLACEEFNIDIFCENYIYRNAKFKNGKQNGKWAAETFFIPPHAGTNKAIKYICREEYFKNGLRDSIYKIYNKDGKIIYSTYFKNGNGIEKDFHENGKLYYEIETKEGYFIDTLKLYNDKGILSEKLLYKKDSLIFREKMIFDENTTDNKN